MLPERFAVGAERVLDPAIVEAHTPFIQKNTVFPYYSLLEWNAAK